MEKESKKFCKNCGAELENSREFCPNCGKKQPKANISHIKRGVIIGGIVMFCLAAIWWVTRTNNHNANSGEESYTESDGTRITKSESGIRTQVKRIPYKEICYNCIWHSRRK